ncbi:MAG: 3-hydroxyacyl-ACP dehydratase FabZ [Desulfobacterota bacterium]|nr:3-hydroxyacyl-ACP dehydratase FabZ [Thermodesulfobacteriota bacterium]
MEKSTPFMNLPHGFPFRMIDRVLEVEPGRRAVAVKQVSIDEPYLQGHYPKEPLLPSLLILEALAQTAGMAFLSSTEGKEGVPFLAKVETFRVDGKVLPGDSLTLEAEIEHIFSNLAKVRVRARVEEEVVAEGVVVLARGTG